MSCLRAVFPFTFCASVVPDSGTEERFVDAPELASLMMMPLSVESTPESVRTSECGVEIVMFAALVAGAVAGDMGACPATGAPVRSTNIAVNEESASAAMTVFVILLVDVCKHAPRGALVTSPRRVGEMLATSIPQVCGYAC